MFKRKKIVFLTLFLALLGTLLWYQKAPKFFLVSEVIDGDTIRLADGRRIRYINVDCSEMEEAECFAQEAREVNKRLVEGKKVRLEFDKNEMDYFGRFLAYVFLEDGTFVNEYLLSEGAGKYHLDTVNLRYSHVLIEDAEKAHEAKRGLWGKCARDDKGCLVKGNYDVHGHRWYHLPDFRHYKQTRVNLGDGDQWFCSEEEAIKAGFARARK